MKQLMIVREWFAMKAIGAVIAGIFFSSCMHMSMPMMRGGNDHQADTDPVVEKEIMFGDVKAVATFPPLNMDDDVVLTLKLSDAKTLHPISDAKVYFRAQYVHKTDSDEVQKKRPVHDHSNNGRSQGIEREHEENVDQEVKESDKRGVYTVSYGSSQPGEHTLMFHIVAVGDTKFEPEVRIEATRSVVPQQHEHGSGMMRMGSTGTYVLIGAAIMGAMMVAMVLARGSMF